MSWVAKWQDDQDWAQAEVYHWLWKSLKINVPGPEDPGTGEMLASMAQTLDASRGDDERIGALLMQLTLACRALLYMASAVTGESREDVLSRLLPGPPDSRYDIGGAPL